MKEELKDWQVAQMMFGKNTKHHCVIIKNLRKHGRIIYHCDGWALIKDNRLEYDCGFLIPDECYNQDELTVEKTVIYNKLNDLLNWWEDLKIKFMKFLFLRISIYICKHEKRD